MPSPNIPDVTKARQDLASPPPGSRIGALEPWLYGIKNVKIMVNNSNNE